MYLLSVVGPRLCTPNETVSHEFAYYTVIILDIFSRLDVNCGTIKSYSRYRLQLNLHLVDPYCLKILKISFKARLNFVLVVRHAANYSPSKSRFIAELFYCATDCSMRQLKDFQRDFQNTLRSESLPIKTIKMVLSDSMLTAIHIANRRCACAIFNRIKFSTSVHRVPSLPA